MKIKIFFYSVGHIRWRNIWAGQSTSIHYYQNNEWL